MIVFNHVLVSGFLFYRNPRRFLVDVGCKSDAGNAKSKELIQELQENEKDLKSSLESASQNTNTLEEKIKNLTKELEENKKENEELKGEMEKMETDIWESTEFRCLHQRVRDAIQHIISKSEADIQLWAKADFRCLHERVRKAILIHYIASKSVTAIVYLLDENSQELYGDIEHRRKLPTNGICWETWSMQKVRVCQNLDPGDPVSSELAGIRGNIAWKPRCVVCFPAVDDRSEKVIAVLVVGSNFSEDINADNLKPLAEQIIACYRNMRDGSMQEQYQETVSSPAMSDKEAIVKLCEGELYEQDASNPQPKVIKQGMVTHRGKYTPGLSSPAENESYETAVESLEDCGNDLCGDVCSGAADLVKSNDQQQTCCVGNLEISARSEILEADEEETTSANNTLTEEFDFSINSSPEINRQAHTPISVSPRSSNPASLYEPSDASSEMFSCMEFEASDFNPNVDEFNCADIEGIPLDAPQLYHDAWAGSSTRVRGCRSVPLDSQLEGYDLEFSNILNTQTSTPRFSISDSAIRKYDPKHEIEES